DSERRTRAAGRRLEACVARDHVVGEDAAVTPAADAEPGRIGDPQLHDLIDRGLQIVDLIVAPVGGDRLRELRPASGAPAIVHRQDGVAVRREPLPLEAEGMLVLRVRAAMNPEQHRNLRAWNEARRLRQQSVYFRAVLALRADLFDGSELERRKQL